MFKTTTIFRIQNDWAPPLDEMEVAAGAALFAPCSPSQDEARGWVPPRGEENGAIVESINGQRIMKLMIETKVVPGTAVREKAQAAADHIEDTTGRKPGRKEMKELKEDARQALLPQAFPRRAAVLVWFDFANSLLVVDANSQGKVDDVVTALVRAFDGLALTQLQTAMTPQTAMTCWLSTTDPENDWPEGFNVERRCVLKSADEEKSVVKFDRHHLLTDEVRKHIAEGKLPTSLAMSWEGRIGFTMDESMHLRDIAFLEGVFDDRPSDETAGFDTDVVLATGELGKLIPALVAALGGEIQPGAALPDAPGGAVAAHIDGVPVDPFHNNPNGDPDPLLEQARALVIAEQKASISYVQRVLKIGYNRAARLLEDLEALKVVSSMSSAGVRDVLVRGAA